MPCHSVDGRSNGERTYRVQSTLILSLLWFLSTVFICAACDSDPDTAPQDRGYVDMDIQGAGERASSGGDQSGGARAGVEQSGGDASSHTPGKTTCMGGVIEPESILTTHFV